MKFCELNESQLEQLAQHYLIALDDEGVLDEVIGIDCLSYGVMASASDIVPYDVLEQNYGDVEFSDDDFFC